MVYVNSGFWLHWLQQILIGTVNAITRVTLRTNDNIRYLIYCTFNSINETGLIRFFKKPYLCIDIVHLSDWKKHLHCIFWIHIYDLWILRFPWQESQRNLCCKLVILFNIVRLTIHSEASVYKISNSVHGVVCIPIQVLYTWSVNI